MRLLAPLFVHRLKRIAGYYVVIADFIDKLYRFGYPIMRQTPGEKNPEF
jgi:hypothetical protein